ncbi:MAG: lamin tail domain-containing protein [Chloroflexi bacterium]|nr:lamin tail domain-containing protein [Chloroflexota bacterium]
MPRIFFVLMIALLGAFVLLALAAPLALPASAQCGRTGCPPPKEPPQQPEPQEPREPREPLADRRDDPTRAPVPTPAPTSTPEPTRVTVSTIPSPEPSAGPNIPLATQTATAPEPVVVATSTPLPPATVLAMPTFPTTIVLNEYRVPDRNAENEWIELYNLGDSSVDLSGWQLAHTANGGGAYIIPSGTTIAPRGFRVFTRAQTGLTLNSQSDDVQLVYPNGAVADTTRHSRLRDNQVYARSVDGAGLWLADCKPTPNTANCPLVAGASSYFRDHIATPSLFGALNVAALITNFLLALVLALAMGFFGNMLNDVLESHEPEIAAWFAPIRPVIYGIRNAATQFDDTFAKWRLSLLGWVIKLGFMLVLYGIVFAYLDPSFDITQPAGWLLIAALALSAGVIGVIDDLAQYAYLRRRGSRGTIRLHGGNLLLSILSAMFSRFSGLTPGLLFGNPAGIEDVDDPHFEIPSHFIALGAMGILAIAAWLLTPLIDEGAWLHTTLLLIFALGVQSVFFEMLPIKYLHGKGIFQYNRWLWVILFALTTTVFFQTMLNPNGDFVHAFQQSNMIVLSLTVIGFCILSAGLWYYFQRVQKATAQG